ncbi:MAG TPA: glycoside hydrolase family 97 catalytic domain-containing protein [Clostridia bacterium]|nr:glycoside hydrolase family 97 catalytic domain-containing protein [Clostridia bacterium]
MVYRKTAHKTFKALSVIKGIGAAVTPKTAKKSKTFEGADYDSNNSQTFFVESPNKRITANLIGGERLTYNVSFNGETVISDSVLGLKVKKNVDLGADVCVGVPKIKEHCEEYKDRGLDNLCVDNHVLYTFPIKHNPTGFEYIFEIKVWDDGFGFRYVFSSGTRLLINDELTEFKLPIDSTCFYQTDVVKLQEKTLEQKTRYLPSNVDFACLSTFKLAENKGYAMLTESNLDNYPGAALRSKGRGVFKINLWDSEDFYVKSCVSPWRLVILCQTLNELINCDVIKNAAEPMLDIFKDEDWIKPGRSTWSYFVNNPTSRKFGTIMDFNKYTQDLGFEYSVIDSGWIKWGITEGAAFKKVKKVVDDAKKRNVGIWVWKSIEKGPYSSLYRKWFFRQCKKAGVKGVKLDHIESETQFQINLYRNFLYEAAKNQLMVIFHNPNKPTGLSRTYPNLLSMEAIRGTQGFCDEDDNTILPFTRFVAGDADYTPLCFSVKERRGSATIPHMLGTCVVFTSSFLTISEHPENLKKHMFLDFVKSLPSTWDKTICLPQSVLGDLAVFARQKGNNWYIGGLNSKKGEREVELDFSFLPGEGNYTLELFVDDFTTNRYVERIEYSVYSNEKLQVRLDDGGGFAGRLIKKD